MRAIAAEYFAGSDVMGWPLVALVLFIAVFAAAVIALVRRGPAAYDAVARLPLEGDREDRP